MRVLAGDIGGTKTLLQIAEVGQDGYRGIWEKRFESQAYDDFQPMLDEFMAQAEAHAPEGLDAACFGVAGPVMGGTAKVTNLPWVLDRRAMGLGCRVLLVNDFQAVGYGIEGLASNELVSLQEGKARAHGTRALIGAGTGLGEAMMVWDGRHYTVLPSEGGHVDFAPTDALQNELLHYLRQELERVTYERILSGSGLVRIYKFLQSREPRSASTELQRAMESGDPAAAIGQAARTGSDALAVQALDVFVRIYGAQAGNLALTALATGGVFIAGGIAPHIIDKLRDGTFIKAFTAKVPMTALVKKMPVQVIMNPKVGLIGTALAAARYASLH